MALTIARWRPLAEMEDMRRRMERMLEELGDGDTTRTRNLSIDLIDRDDNYVLRPTCRA